MTLKRVESTIRIIFGKLMKVIRSYFRKQIYKVQWCAQCSYYEIIGGQEDWDSWLKIASKKGFRLGITIDYSLDGRKSFSWRQDGRMTVDLVILKGDFGSFWISWVLNCNTSTCWKEIEWKSDSWNVIIIYYEFGGEIMSQEQTHLLSELLVA